MRTSATTNSRFNLGSGFSLLEIMVVAALVALLAAVAVPTIMRNPGGDAVSEHADRLSGFLQQLNEQSLFLGQMLAVRFETDAVHPLRFAQEEGQFVAMEGAGELGTLELPEALRLEWRLEKTDERQGVNLREAVSSRMMADEDDTREPDEEASPPQVFFFPSGEVTPITLWLRHQEREGEGVRLELNSLGRVQRPADENGSDEE